MTTKKSNTKDSTRGKAEGSKEKRRATVKDRARAIVANVKGYDEETRHTINNMLRENSKELAEFVRRAESGEELYDLVSPLPSTADFEARARVILADLDHDYDTRHAVHLALQCTPDDRGERLRVAVERAEAGESEPSGAGEQYDAAAIRVLRLMYSPGVPDFITQGIYDTLLAAEKVFGVKLYRNGIGKDDEQGGFSLAALAYTFRHYPGKVFTLEVQKTLPELLAAVIQHKETPTELRDTMRQFLGHLTEPNEVTIHPAVLKVALSVYWRDKEGGDS
ncbi:MAG: hypothetical protein ACJ74Q_21480 [Pyrinomonadaceae bacterium]